MNKLDKGYILRDKNIYMLEAQNKNMEKLPPKAHILSGWPLILIAFGGLVGGGLGGGAYAINLQIYKSNLSNPVKILLNIVTGVAAFLLWFVIAIAIRSQMEN